jgi:hypothetical protein
MIMGLDELDLKEAKEDFAENGWAILPELVEPSKLTCDIPQFRGSIHYHGSLDDFSYSKTDSQVEGSLSRYNYPPYKEVHYEIKNKLESFLGEKLYPTYYYDRFYFSGQELKRHTDRDSCEISVSVHVRTDLERGWNFEILTENTSRPGSHCITLTVPGDAILYKGCERPHWRNPMPYGKEVSGDRLRKVMGRKVIGGQQLCYHQAFFHYVFANGTRSHHANDMAFEHECMNQKIQDNYPSIIGNGSNQKPKKLYKLDASTLKNVKDIKNILDGLDLIISEDSTSYESVKKYFKEME